MDKVASELPKRQLLVIMILLCIGYYALACWISYSQASTEILLGHPPSLWTIILFWSGLAGLIITIVLMIPFSEKAKRILGYLLGVNAGVSAIGWLLGGLFVFLLSLIGVVQVIYFLFPKGFQYNPQS